MEYKEEVELALKEKGKKRKWLADQLDGVSYSTLTQYLNKFQPMPSEIKDAIDEILDIPAFRRRMVRKNALKRMI